VGHRENEALNEVAQAVARAELPSEFGRAVGMKAEFLVEPAWSKLFARSTRLPSR